MELQELINQSRRIVFFGGAGVSTESGIPDFRSQDGLYHQHYAYPPEQILSHSFFMQRPEEFYRFYDDVCTTGATLTACANVLKDIPGIRISVLTLGFTKS